MVEFRTRAPGGSDTGGSGGSGIEGHLNNVIENIKSDPELQARLLQEAEANDVDPTLLRAVFPQAGKALEEAQQQQAQQAQRNDTDTDTEPRIRTVTEKPDADDLLALIDEIAELSPNGEETTLGYLRDWGDENRDVLQTAIEMKL